MDVYDMLINALKKKEFDAVLLGEKGYDLPTPYMCPVEKMPTDWDKLLVKGIYKVYKVEPTYRIDEIIEKSLVRIAKDLKGIYSSLNVFFEQLMNEKYKLSPFVLNKEEIVKILAIKIIENKQKFINDKRWGGGDFEDGLWGEITRICDIIYEDYNIKLL